MALDELFSMITARLRSYDWHRRLAICSFEKPGSNVVILRKIRGRLSIISWHLMKVQFPTIFK